jgi:hypothetical protein
MAVAAAVVARHQAGTSTSGTLVLRGNMSSTAALTMTGAFSVGHAANLDWDLPVQTSSRLNGYTQHIDSIAYRFNIRPDSSSDVTVDGHPVRRFHWDAPPANKVIRVVESLHATISSNLSPFHSNAPYPLASLPPDAARYGQITPMTQLPPAARSFVRRFASGHRTEQAVVDAAANWVAANTHYSTARLNGPYDAAWVFAHHEATCQGYDNLMAGILRSLGIPAQVQYGWVAATPLKLPGPDHGTSSIQWSTPGSQGELHTWLNIYFPGSGWVPFDPQREKYFVDPRHIAFLTAQEAGTLRLGTWSAQQVDGQSPIGPNLAGGVAAIVPADGVNSKVTVRTRDNFHVALSGVRSDVKNVLLLAR